MDKTNYMRVRVSVDCRLADRLALLMSPFLDLQESSTNATSLWHIIQVDSGQMLDHLEYYNSIHPEEPMQQLWIDPTARVIYVLCEEVEFLPLMLTRLVSHILRLQCLYAGHCFVHAAAVSYNGSAVAIAGAKRSGKTTLTLSLMRWHNAQFISNDNLSITCQDHTAHCHGWPRSMRIRSDAIYSVGLCQDQNSSVHTMTLTHPQNCGLKIPFAPVQLPSAIHIFPFELDRFYNRSLIPTSRLSAIVFLVQLDRQVKPSLHRLAADEAEELMCNHAFPRIEMPGLEHAPYLKKHFLTDTTIYDPHAAIVRCVPCYLLADGLNASKEAANLLAQLFPA
jgi:hypothetical protein